MRRLLLSLLALALLIPAGAQATTTMTIVEKYEEGYKGSGGTYATMTVTGDDAASDVTIERSAAAFDQRSFVTVRDPFGALPGPGCAAIDDGAPGTAVRCTLSLYSSLTGVSVFAGGGDDRVDLTKVNVPSVLLEGGAGDDLLRTSGGFEKLVGGPGRDVLQAGAGDDFLDGGTGEDVVDGGAGVDHASWRSNTAAVRIDLAAQSAAGADGENDQIVGIEAASGGAGNDVISGTDAGEDLSGGGGDDVIEGFGGSDQLIGDLGKDRVLGGPGNDSLYDGDGAVLDGGSGNDRISTDSTYPQGGQWSYLTGGLNTVVVPGPALIYGREGNDALTSGAGADRIDAGPGADAVETRIGGGDTVLLRDGTVDQLICGGPATVNADAADFTVRCPKVLRDRPARPYVAQAGRLRQTVDGHEGFVSVTCSSDQRPRCRGTVRVFVGGRLVGRARYVARPGTQRGVYLCLAPWVAAQVAERGALRVRYHVDTRDGRGRPFAQRRNHTIAVVYQSFGYQEAPLPYQVALRSSCKGAGPVPAPRLPPPRPAPPPGSAGAPPVPFVPPGPAPSAVPPTPAPTASPALR